MLEIVLRDMQRLRKAWQLDGADEAGVAALKAFEIALRCGDADLVRNVDGEKVAGLEEAIDCAEIDVVGVAEVWLAPVEFMDSGVRGRARLRRFGADDGVLAVGFIPHRHDKHSGSGSLHAGLELSARLMGKAVSYAD
jgi:hypothetical protein